MNKRIIILLLCATVYAMYCPAQDTMFEEEGEPLIKQEQKDLVETQNTQALVKENELAIVYYMPYTKICLEVIWEEVEETPGPFYPYAERYLGTKQVITAASTTHVLKDIQIHTKTIKDERRVYKVIAEKGIQSQLLALTEQGLLYGYNVSVQTNKNSYKKDSTSIKKKATESDVWPLLEEQMVAASTTKMAEGAAKQIYHIRETRLNILAGEVEHAPADGKAMEIVMNELDKQEKELTALFIGSRKVKKHRKYIYWNPDDNTTQAIPCRFSSYAGPVDSQDLSGEPIYLQLESKRQRLDIAEIGTNKKAPIASQIYYNLPGSMNLRIYYKGQLLAQKMDLPIAQWGVAIPLAQDLFTTPKLPIIRIDTQTGNIRSIQESK